MSIAMVAGGDGSGQGRCIIWSVLPIPYLWYLVSSGKDTAEGIVAQPTRIRRFRPVTGDGRCSVVRRLDSSLENPSRGRRCVRWQPGALALT